MMDSISLHIVHVRAIGRQLLQGSHASWKVMELRCSIFQAWKVMESSLGHGKVMEFKPLVMKFFGTGY
jgi:hypothetical protein